MGQLGYWRTFLLKKLRQVLVSCLVVSILSAVFMGTVYASETTYETNSWITIQFIGNAPGMDEERGYNGDFGWNHTFSDPTLKIIYDVNLTIRAWDVDYVLGEYDRVYADGVYVGELMGENGTWTETSFLIDPSLLYDDGILHVWLDIDALENMYTVEVDWSRLRTHWDYIDPVGNASDELGCLRDLYTYDETVYAVGSGFPPDVDIDIYVVPDQEWIVDMVIPADVSSDGVNTVHTSATGTFDPVIIWPALLRPGAYDVVFDVEQDGLYTEYFETYTDGVDDPNHPGFVVDWLVGGEVLAANPLELLAPYLMVGTTVAGTLAALYRKRRP